MSASSAQRPETRQSEGYDQVLHRAPPCSVGLQRVQTWGFELVVATPFLQGSRPLALRRMAPQPASCQEQEKARRARSDFMSRRSEFCRMNHDQLTLYLAFSLFIGLPMGLIGMLLWTKRVWSRIRKSAERYVHVSVGRIAVMSLFYVSPGLLLLLACSLPAIYFNHLLKQQSYCVEVVRTNRGIARDHPDLKARCGYFDMNELFASARGGP
jgi:hypothetical protein